MSGDGEDRRLAPVDQKTRSVTVGTSALGGTLLTGGNLIGPAQGGPGPGYYTCEATGGKIAVVFGKSTGMGAPALSGVSKNSETIPEDATRDFWLTADETHFNAIASTAGCTLTIRRSSK